MTARDLPMLFSGPMVRALIREIEQPGCGKTQTRRTIKKPGLMAAPYNMRATDKGIPVSIDDWGAIHYRPLPYRVGDRLYVREHWRTGGQHDHLAPRDLPREWAGPIGYIADEAPNSISRTGRFRQGMHMPRWASRLTLTVTDVRVERLLDISEADAIAEGIIHPWNKRYPFGLQISDDAYCLGNTATQAYRALWNHINGPGSWDATPWVAAYTFTVAVGNIDTLARAA
ncbi:hypothetical protein [Devosia ginsengisoli]|uniref:hypothetical protein n=1 Tax=Devosia ginsengisoli TaxID=400770 RepID=UPI0026F25766|nr:hypothetical protein [Devosia ginsengisoli]MCR6673267.1 hypothetical protein [Devosia ginsengisoli]